MVLVSVYFQEFDSIGKENKSRSQLDSIYLKSFFTAKGVIIKTKIILLITAHSHSTSDKGLLSKFYLQRTQQQQNKPSFGKPREELNRHFSEDHILMGNRTMMRSLHGNKYQSACEMLFILVTVAYIKRVKSKHW